MVLCVNDLAFHRALTIEKKNALGSHDLKFRREGGYWSPRLEGVHWKTTEVSSKKHSHFSKG